MNQKVFIAGGGIAGMVAATLLAEQGFQVDIYELSNELGGKAKSLRTNDHPIEHSHRIYSKQYRTLLKILSRIPDKENYVINNLISSKGIMVTKADGKLLMSRQYRTKPLNTIEKFIFSFFRFFLDTLRIILLLLVFPYTLSKNGVPLKESFSCLIKHLYVLLICDSRKEKLLAGKSYGDFLDIENKSEAFRKTMSSLLSIIVTARLETEALCCVNVFNAAFLRMPLTTKEFEHLSPLMIMNGPTSERLFNQWKKYLIDLGVNIHLGIGINQINCENGLIKSVSLSNGKKVTADNYVCAIPQVALAKLIKQGNLQQLAPSLNNVNEPKMEWTNGCQFFLKALPSKNANFFKPGVHSFYLHSSWDVVSIVQGEGVWENVEMPETAPYILSVTWSDAHSKGIITNKPSIACSPDQIYEELLAQMNFLDRDLIVGWHLDNELLIIEEKEYQKKKESLKPHLAGEVYDGKRTINYAPLALMLPHGKPLKTVTQIPNLFLAGEHIDTSFRAPTMEKAAESGQRAAIEIAKRVDESIAKEITLKDYDVIPFSFLQRLDALLYRLQWKNGVT